jgi:hypothetical protein
MKELAFYISIIINLLIFFRFELKDKHDMEAEYCPDYVHGSDEIESCLNDISVILKVKYTGN